MQCWWTCRGLKVCPHTNIGMHLQSGDRYNVWRWRAGDSLLEVLLLAFDQLGVSAPEMAECRAGPEPARSFRQALRRKVCTALGDEDDDEEFMLYLQRQARGLFSNLLPYDDLAFLIATWYGVHVNYVVASPGAGAFEVNRFACPAVEGELRLVCALYYSASQCIADTEWHQHLLVICSID